MDAGNYTEHNPGMPDGFPALEDALGKMASSRQYQVIHRILAEGNFTEGTLGGEQASFYDLFRIAGGKIVEHWDTVEEVPPKSEWQNDNGKF